MTMDVQCEERALPLMTVLAISLDMVVAFTLS